MPSKLRIRHTQKTTFMCFFVIFLHQAKQSQKKCTVRFKRLQTCDRKWTLIRSRLAARRLLCMTKSVIRLGGGCTSVWVDSWVLVGCECLWVVLSFSYLIFIHTLVKVGHKQAVFHKKLSLFCRPHFLFLLLLLLHFFIIISFYFLPITTCIDTRCCFQVSPGHMNRLYYSRSLLTNWAHNS